MDSATMDDTDTDIAAPEGEVCGLGVPYEPCFSRDGARALDEDLACAFCGYRPVMRWVGNACRSAAGMAVQEDARLIVGAPAATREASAAELHSAGLVGVYAAV